MHIKSTKNLDKYSLEFEVWTNSINTELYRLVRIGKDGREMSMDYPTVTIIDFPSNDFFLNECIRNHLATLETHAIHAISYAQLTGL